MLAMRKLSSNILTLSIYVLSQQLANGVALKLQIDSHYKVS